MEGGDAAGAERGVRGRGKRRRRGEDAVEHVIPGADAIVDERAVCAAHAGSKRRAHAPTHAAAYAADDAEQTKRE